MKFRSKAFLEEMASKGTALLTKEEVPEICLCQTCGNDVTHWECPECTETAFPVVPDLFKDIPEEEEGSAEESQMNRLMRVHRNLGHPSNR